MKNKQKKRPSNGSVSELILSAVYFLQKKNGVTAKDITKYICQKRGFKQSQMKNKVKEALQRGTKNGIFNLKRGLYKVGEDYRKKLTILKKKVKKKTEANKIPKQIIQNKISLEKNVDEERKLTPINECPKQSTIFRDRMGSHKLSEDIFDRRGRENSYFEPSVLARPSDEEYDDYDDEEDDNEDDENSEIDENRNPDIFTFSFADDLSHERFPELDVYNATRQGEQKEMCEKEKKRRKSSNTGKGKKTKISKAREKKSLEEEKKKSKQVKSNCDDDDEADDEDDQCNHGDNKDKEDDGYLDEEDESDYSGKTDIGKVKENKFIVRPKVKKSEKKEKTGSELARKCKSKKEIRENKEAKDNKVNQKKKEKQEQLKKTKKYKKSKRESSEENTVDEKRDSFVTKSEKSLSKSNCLITSSTKLLPSDFKLSITPNMVVSDMKFSPTNMKFENLDSSRLLLSGKTKIEPTDKSLKEKEFFDNIEIFCECQPPKRKNLPYSCESNLTNGTEPIQKRIRSKRSEK